MDETDYLILSQLLVNAQMSFLQIAKKLGISSFTVKNRYDKMVKDGVIKCTSVNIDLSKLGYQGKMFMLITSASNCPKEVTIEALKKIRNIISISEIIGPFDIIAIAAITDFNSIKDLINEAKKIPSVQRVNINCVNETAFPLSTTFGKVLSKQSQSLASAS